MLSKGRHQTATGPDSFEFPDGRLEFKWKGVSLPFTVFDKDQRVTHAAVTENKRLGAVLAMIKDTQEKEPPKKRRAGKQRTKYEPTGRKQPGRPSGLEDYYARRRAERESAKANEDSGQEQNPTQV